MKKYFLFMLVVIVGLSFTDVVFAEDHDATKKKGGKVVSTYEDLAYIFKSYPNEALFQKAEDFCAKAYEEGLLWFEPDPFFTIGQNWYAMETKGGDGSVVNWGTKYLAEELSCGAWSDELRDGEFWDYTLITFGSKDPITMVAEGTCRFMRDDSPEPGGYPYLCNLWITDRPPGYIDGLLTSNGLAFIGPTLGYKPGGIATLRIFRERGAAGLIDDGDD